MIKACITTYLRDNNSMAANFSMWSPIYVVQFQTVLSVPQSLSNNVL